MREIAFKSIINNITVGMIVGSITAFHTISLASLIFSSEFSSYLSYGVHFLLIGAIVMGGVVALLGSVPGQIAAPQDSACAILALMATAISTGLPMDTPVSEKVVTFVCAMSISAFIVGVVFLIIARFQSGNFLRNFPYPIISGLLAGIGWVIISGAMEMMTTIPLRISNLPSLLSFPILMKWLIGIAFFLFLLKTIELFHSIIVFPTILLGAMGLFHASIWNLDIPMQIAVEQGWMLGVSSKVNGLALNLTLASKIHWSMVFKQAHFMIIMATMSFIMLAFNIRAIELASGRHVDARREVYANGLANMIAAFGSGGIGFTLLTETSLVHRFRAKHRWTGVVAAGMSAVVLLNITLLSFIPKFVVGGVLVYVGYGFLKQWLVESFSKLSSREYAVVLLVFVSIVVLSY